MRRDDMNTALAQHDETGRMLEWPMEKPLPHGYSWIVGSIAEYKRIRVEMGINASVSGGFEECVSELPKGKDAHRHDATDNAEVSHGDSEKRS